MNTFFSKVLFDIQQYLIYWSKAQGITFLHSPFLYNLYENVIKDDKMYYAFSEIENLRFDFLLNNSEIHVKDLGAGSHILKNNIKKISQITKYSALQSKEGRILFRLVEYLKPNYMIELGTSLGIGTLYLHLGSPHSVFYSVEGCPNVSDFAQKNIKNFTQKFPKTLTNAEKLHFEVGNIDDILPNLIEKLPQIDFVYLDANHRFEPTMRYFELILPKITQKTVLVFDDIHWSKEMLKAWNEIKKHPKITLAIDLYNMGIVFFDDNLSKEFFVLK